MLDTVTTLAGAPDLASLGLPNRVVVMLGSDDCMGDFVEHGILDLRAGGGEGIADGQVNAMFSIAADAGAGRSEIEPEGPSQGQGSTGLEFGHQALTQGFDFPQRAFGRRRPIYRLDSGVWNPPLHSIVIDSVSKAGSN